MAPPPPGAFRGRKLLLPWVAAAVLLGALVVTGRLLDDDRAGAPAGRGPTRTGGTAAPSARPAGTVEIEGFSLVPTSRAFQASCQQAADRLGFAVPCPELLPIPASGETPSRLCQEAGACRDELVWFPLEGFVVPPGSTGAPGSLGALTILATPDRRAGRGPGFWCPTQRPIATPTLGGRRAVLATCPAGFQGWSADSVLLRWSHRGTFMTLGLRGPSDRNQRLAVAFAGHLQLVPPRT